MARTLPKTGLYEEDFNLWLEAQASLLREGRLDELDVDNLIEEVEAISRGDKREVRNRLTVLLAHLLKWQHQAASRRRSWLNTIREQRRQLRLIFQDSPSLLKHFAPSILGESYEDARQDAHDEMGLPLDLFPKNCPYALERVLDETFLPDA